MRILLDHCVDRRIARFLPDFAVESASSRGWDRLRNGQLLAAATAAGFDAVLTVDRGIKHQQNPTTLPVAVVVLEAPSLDLATLARGPGAARSDPRRQASHPSHRSVRLTDYRAGLSPLKTIDIHRYGSRPAPRNWMFVNPASRKSSLKVARLQNLM